MTIRIPKTVLGLLAVLVLGGGGVAAGYFLLAEPGTTTVVVETVTTPRTVDSTTTSSSFHEQIDGKLGEQVLRDLLYRDAISEVKAVEPQEGWETEFEVDTGGGEIRFRQTRTDKQIEWEYYRTAAGRGFHDAVEEVAEERGFEDL